MRKWGRPLHTAFIFFERECVYEREKEKERERKRAEDKDRDGKEE